MKEKRNPIYKKLLILITGLMILALGVALSLKSGLGVSPSSSLSYLLSLILPLSMGNVTILINVIYILIQIVLLGKEYRLMNLFQLLAVVIFGYFTDLMIALLSDITIEGYLIRLICCVLSCALMGMGLYFEINARLLTMASEGAISVIADKTKKDFGTVKIVNDCLFVLLSLLISLSFFKRVEGIREGTLLSAILVGFFSQLFSRYLPLFKEKEESVPYQIDGKYPLVITIERELGSGGHEIGQELAKKLGIAFYDYELIEKTAAETGLANELITKKEERVNSIWYTLYNQSYGYTQKESETDEIFEAQKKVIRELANKESCVIVGRLGSFILKERPNTFNIFISADREYRAQRLAEAKGTTKTAMVNVLKREDNLRKSYCLHFTGKPWGLARHYHLCVDSSVYGKEGSFELIDKAVDEFAKTTE